MTQYLDPVLKGFFLNIGLIIALGPQNTFILRQGLKREYVFIVAFLSSILNIPLVIIGVYGFGFAINSSAALHTIIFWGSAVFLFIYGLMSFRSAFASKIIDNSKIEQDKSDIKKIIACIFAFSWLNPHAILDTVVLVGSVGAHYSHIQRIYYIIGASFAEFLFLFTLAYGAYLVAPLFKKPSIWKWVDILISLIMWVLAGLLIVSELTKL